jgi:hypothetical protein
LFIVLYIVMYRSEQVDKAIERFNEGALEERLRYKPIYIAIEDYISQFATDTQDLVIMGGTHSIDLLLGKPLGRDDFIYNLFSENAFTHCNALTNLIADVVKNLFKDSDDPLYWTVFMKTTMAYKKFDILVDQRVLVRWTVLKNMSEDSSLYKLIEPLNVKSYFQKKTIFIMPPRFHLVETYRTLYSPNEFDNWQQALLDERRLFGYMKRIMDLQSAGKSIVVGADDASLGQRRQITALLLDEFVKNNPKIILLGEHAINILTKSAVDTTILHIAIDHDLSLNDIKPTIDAICQQVVRDKLTFSTRDVQILSDFRLRRTSVKLGTKEIMYIYNPTSYDLIPTNKIFDKHRNIILIGNPFVLIRFMLIELWIVNWIKSIGKIDSAFAKSRINSIIGKILGLRSKLSADSSKTSIDDKFVQPGPMQIFQTNNLSYLGQFESDDKAQKTKAQTQQRFSDYFPQEYMRKNGTYRTFTTDAE